MEDSPSGSPPVQQAASPKPILMSAHSATAIQGHSARRSISGSDIFNGFKIKTALQNESSQPQLSPDTHVFNNIDEFDVQTAIGYGSSAVVYSAIYKPSNKRVAIKMIDLDMFERNQIDELRRETTLMALSKHPNVLRVYGSFVKGSKLYIVTPYLAGGSCLDIMKTCFSEGLDELSIATILKQTLEGLAYLHKNGHIHRDVKAGNLLMDEDGTVLLADFGVSSSLMETGERGFNGLRKTFVGTPCWMAPEVMEQAGYDYKADIWSFGITSIELATGHAPFAKLPPLKVLMMTLSNDPPTLARETTKHKYSRVFKDMIDMCLHKDPTKRPSAEKLLQHPFFKQAKKREYLIKTIVAGLPPLEQRSHKKVPQRHVTITKTDEWDFDDDLDEENSIVPNQAIDASQSENILTKSQPKSLSSKRHISFGDVVVRNPPQPSTMISSGQVLTGATGTMQSADILAPSGTPPRRSRFVVEEISHDYVDSFPTTGSSTRSTSPFGYPFLETETKDECSDGEVKKGRFSVNQAWKQTQVSEGTLSSGHLSEESTSSEKALYRTPSQENMSDRKSRFEVHHASHQGSISSVSTSPPLHMIPLSRENSLSSAGTALTREGSMCSKPPRYVVDKDREGLREKEFDGQYLNEPRKVGRFELTGGTGELGSRLTVEKAEGKCEGKQSAKVEMRPLTVPLHPYESPHPALSLSATTSPSSSVSRGQSVRMGHDPALLQSQFEELVRHNEAQQQMLQDMCNSFGLKVVSKQKPSNDQRTLSNLHPTVVPSTQSVDTAGVSAKQVHPGTMPGELLSTMDYLEHLVQLSLRENASLQRENESLQRELDQLRADHSAKSGKT